MAMNVSACSLFSEWLLYKSIFLLARLFSAITAELLAWNLKYLLLKHCRLCLKKFGSCASYAEKVTNVNNYDITQVNLACTMIKENKINTFLGSDGSKHQ